MNILQFLQTCWDCICDFFWKYVAAPFYTIGWRDVLDILLLAVLLYSVYRFARTRRAGRVSAGLLLVVLLSIVITALELPALSYIIRLFASVAFFCFVLIFQPEIRDGLERLGNSRAISPRSDTLPKKQLPAARVITAETVDAVFKMSETRTGALIVFEGLTALGDCAESGKIVDAMLTSHTLQNIFYDKAPLHDGAVIIRDMRIWKASCVLPSTKSQMDFGSMGTRHRAAVGVTEVSDALVVVVSEQTGTVSAAQDGKLIRDLDRETLADILLTYIAGRLYVRTKRQEEKAARAVAAMEEKSIRRAKEERRRAEKRELREILPDQRAKAAAEESARAEQEAQKNENKSAKDEHTEAGN